MTRSVTAFTRIVITCFCFIIIGNVIYALAENSSHIPYRDSKLTRLLQDSLGGNSKTIMIANIGPASMNYDETTITLRYAYRAKSIKNQPVKNEDIKDARLIELQNEIERLKKLIMEKSAGKIIPDNLGDLDVEEDSSESEGENEIEKEKKEKEKQLELGKMEVDELSKKLHNLEKQMVHGGKNIVDSVNENEIRLEQQKSEIAARKVFPFPNYEIVLLTAGVFRSEKLKCSKKSNWRKNPAWKSSEFFRTSNRKSTSKKTS